MPITVIIISDKLIHILYVVNLSSCCYFVYMLILVEFIFIWSKLLNKDNKRLINIYDLLFNNAFIFVSILETVVY